MGTEMENPEPLFNQEAVEGERVLLDRGGIKVTQYRFIVGRTVYVMQNIISIRHEIDQPPTPPKPKDNHYRNFGLLGGVACFVSVVVLGIPSVAGILFLVVGVALLAYAYGGLNDVLPASLGDLHTPPQAPPTPAAEHTIKLTSAAGEESLFSTTDGEFVEELLSALNQAMVTDRPK